MNWIISTYWILIPLAVLATGGILLLFGYLNGRQKKEYPMPKRHIVTSKKQSKSTAQPLLIRLPKLGV